MSAKPSVRSSKVIIIIILPSIQFTTWCIIHVNKKHRSWKLFSEVVICWHSWHCSLHFPDIEDHRVHLNLWYVHHYRWGALWCQCPVLMSLHCWLLSNNSPVLMTCSSKIFIVVTGTYDSNLHLFCCSLPGLNVPTQFFLLLSIIACF